MFSRQNVMLMAASIVVGVLLWVYVQAQLDPTLTTERSFDVPLKLLDLKTDLVAMNPPQFTRVVVVGPRRVLDRIESGQIQAFVPLDEAKVGVGRFRVEYSVPAEYRALSWRLRNPDVSLVIEREVSALRSVTVKLRGEPPPEFVYLGSTVQPDRVEIFGPESLVPKVKAVQATLDVTNLELEVSPSVPVEVIGSNGEQITGVRCEPPYVVVRPAVSRAPKSKRVLINATFSGQPEFGYFVKSISVEPNQIALEGPADRLAEATIVQTDSVALSGLTASASFQVRVRPPDGLRVLGNDMVTVRVVIERSPPPTDSSGSPPP